eukprot:scaffold43812_cov39-Tisochrysis_lutea.AAC.3
MPLTRPSATCGACGVPKHLARALNGSIDNTDYCCNCSQPFSVERGDRVAQLILERIYTPDVQEVTELDDTARGGGGFGSTGVQGLPPGAPDVSRPATSPSGANEPQA